MASTSIVSEGNDGGKYFLSKFSEGDVVWVKGTKETIWDLGEITAAFEKSEDNTVAVKTKSGRDVLTKKVFGGEPIPIEGKKVGYSDMTAMRFVNEPQILENLRQRSYNDQPYTFLGPVLVAVNPLKLLDSVAAIKPGQKNVLSLSHPYAIAELSYQQLLFALKRPGENSESPTNQTVIVSGESGAGKTVSSKMVLEHLVSRSGGGELADAMMGSNPITESFGNSTTLRNPNSSRFGKMFRVLYDKNGEKIIGANVGTYLLERSRITTHEVGERNYHIFYELLKGADDSMLEKLHLERDGIYKCLLPHTKIEDQRKVHFNKKDVKNFQDVTNSLKTLGCDDDRYMELMSIVSAVLHMSNIEFDGFTVSGNDASKVSDGTKKHLIAVGELLGVDPGQLELVFTELERKVGVQIIKSTVSATQAAQLLEGVAKALYTRLFEFMVQTVNLYINKAGTTDLPTIGVLDIFGFETFKKNDIEQLLINYTNEALQLTFNKQVLEAEAALYEREKLVMSEADRDSLDPTQVTDKSNKMCIDLLQGMLIPQEKKKKPKKVPGILDIIHDQGMIPSPTEAKMLDKLHKSFANKKKEYPNYLIIRKKMRTEFIVKHYAGKVTYTTGNFLLKNADALPKTANEIFLSSVKETTKAVWDAGASLLSGKKASIVSTFKQQITKLNRDLNSTQCAFIRCLKPNAEMHRNEGWFNRRYITLQLRNLSIPKTADVLKTGLPTRIPYDQLVENYSSVFGDKVRLPDLESETGLKGFIAALFFAFEIPRSCYKLGLTKVFFKSGDLDKLEEVLAAAEEWKNGELDATADAERSRIIQRYRSYHTGRKWKVVFAKMFAAIVFKRLLESQRARKELELHSAIVMQRQIRMLLAKRKFAVMLHEKKLEEERIAREKAEAERKERERLAEIARQKELEKQRQLKKFLEERKEQARLLREQFRKVHEDFELAKGALKNAREKEKEMRRKEKERLEQLEREKREEAERQEREKREEAERQKQELERLRKEREEEERLAAEAAEKERLAKIAYEEKLREEMLRKEKEEEEAARKKAEAEKSETVDIVHRKAYMSFIGAKLDRDQEKLNEKHVMEQVVEEILDREDRENMKRMESMDEGGDVLDDENPWWFYQDLDLDDIDNISQDSDDEERINEALKFLESLGEDESDDESFYDSDLDSLDEETKAYETKGKANLKDYTGPFIATVNFPKLKENQLKKKKGGRGKNQWTQCFAFVYPAHERVLLHSGTDTTTKIQFNPKNSPHEAIVKSNNTVPGKANVIQVNGVTLMDQDDASTNVSRTLLISFQDMKKRDQFAQLLTLFVNAESGSSQRSKINRRSFKLPADNFKPNATAPVFKSRADRRDHVRQQNYTKFALLNKAVKSGKIKKERVHDILLQREEDDNLSDYGTDLTPCVNCGKPVTVGRDICPHCNALQIS